jgi:hypothetical protein
MNTRGSLPRQRIPYAARFSAKTAVASAFAWAPAMELVETLRGAMTGSAWIRVAAIAMGMTALRWAVARSALRAPSAPGAIARLAGGAFLVEAARVAIKVAPAATGVLVSPSVRQAVLSNLVPAPLCTALYAALLGRAVWRHVATESAESADFAVFVGALWVAFPQIAAAALGLLVAPRLSPLASAWLTAAILGVALPFAAALVSRIRIARRRDWLDRASAGAFPGWRVVDPSWRSRSAGLVRLTPGLDKVLLQVVAPGSPFRETDHAPVAAFDVVPPTKSPGLAAGLARLLAAGLAMLATIPPVLIVSAGLEVPWPLVVDSATTRDGTTLVVTQTPDGDPNEVWLSVRHRHSDPDREGEWRQYRIEYGEPLWKGRITLGSHVPIAIIRNYGVDVARFDLSTGQLTRLGPKRPDPMPLLTVNPLVRGDPTPATRSLP